MTATKNFPGEKFNHLTIIRREGPDAVCRCDCGNPELKRVLMGNLKSGKVKSCGCARATRTRSATIYELANKEAKLKLMAMHRTMKQKCYNPNSPQFKNYGAYGVRVCPGWQTSAAFVAWALPRYTEGMFLVLKHLGDFSPENCQFVPKTGNLHLIKVAKNEATLPAQIDRLAWERAVGLIK